MSSYNDPNRPGSGGNVVDLLLQAGVLDEGQADQIRRRAQRSQIPLHQAILELNLIDPENLFLALSETSGIPFVKISDFKIAEEIIRRVPAKVAHHYNFVPLALERGVLTAAFPGQLSSRDRDNLRLMLGMRIEPVLATPDDIKNHQKNLYGLGAETVIQIRQERAAAGSTNQQPASNIYDAGQQNVLDQTSEEDASISKLVNQILLEAVGMNTTDIHIEPYSKTIRLRYRIDGLLRQIPTPPGIVELHNSIISRLKVMANLNIAERRLPQDGRIRITSGTEGFDLRVSIMPTRFGETVCLRILSRNTIFLKMGELGLSPRNLSVLSFLIDLPHGIILVTGPTGSGKTTTLYAALASVRDRHTERKIITVEDPIEYELEGTTQMQMKPEIGLTFASGLRSILRHDPDIVLVGEIRDSETAEIAIRAAMTGHLVLSTLHTNDSVGAVNRLVDMGIEPFLLASSLCACLAQRLVRRIRKHCKIEEGMLPARITTEIARAIGKAPEEVKTWKGRGCPQCNSSGYRGRVAIYEIFLVAEEIQDLISAKSPTGELRKTAIERGMYTLRDDGWIKVSAGQTTVEEVNRLTSNFQISYDVATWEEGH